MPILPQEALQAKPSDHPANSTTDAYQHNSFYFPYFSTPYYILLSLKLTVIPFIVVSSILVIASVIFLKKHHNAHHILFVAIATSDLFIALAVIPIHVLVYVLPTKENLLSDSHRGLCLGIIAIAHFIESVALGSLTILALDTGMQIKFPIVYRKYASFKKTTASLVAIILLNLIGIGSLAGLRFWTNSDCSEKKDSWSDRAYKYFIYITIGLQLVVSLISGIYVRYKRSRIVTIISGKTTSWLLMMFIIFYLPTVLVQLFEDNIDRNMWDVWFHASRIARYLISLTNGPCIFICRPTYRFTFKFFLSNNPIHWNRVERSFRLQDITSTYVSSRASSRFAAEHCATSEIEHQSELLSVSKEEIILATLISCSDSSLSGESLDIVEVISKQSLRDCLNNEHWLSATETPSVQDQLNDLDVRVKALHDDVTALKSSRQQADDATKAGTPAARNGGKETTKTDALEGAQNLDCAIL